MTNIYDIQALLTAAHRIARCNECDAVPYQGTSLSMLVKCVQMHEIEAHEGRNTVEWNRPEDI